jgi:uncharacterized membrane protein (DUF485 family)
VSLAHNQKVLAAARARRRVAFGLTAAMMAIYFGFIGLIAWNKPLLGTQLIPGLSIGLVLGAAVIAACWLLTWLYVRWANTHFDRAVARLRDEGDGR